MARKNVTAIDNPYGGPRWGRLYPGAYQRTTNTWQTRTGRRNSEFGTFANLLGLNTSFDDLHKSDGESPYLRNVRYMGEKEQVQRAQVTSRTGADLLGIKSYRTVPAMKDEYYVEMWEGKAIEFDLPAEKGFLIGGTIKIKNVEKAGGRLKIYLKSNPQEKEICDANLPLDQVSQLDFNNRPFRFINPINMEHGATLRLEIENDINPDEDETPRKIHLQINGLGLHRSAKYERPNTTECLREKAYDWIDEPGTICITQHLSTEVPMLRGTIVCTDDKYLVFPIRTLDNIELWRFNLRTKEYLKIDTSAAPVSRTAKAVRFAQGLGKLYFVDGYSPLQRIDLKTWKSEIAIAKQSDIDVEGVTPEDMQAQRGASLITRVRQRIVLSGFAKDPNFVQYSILNSLTGTPDNPTTNGGVQYDQFSDVSWFYSPDKSPKDSVCGPITALEQYNGSLVVFRKDGFSLWNLGNEFSGTSQEDVFTYNIGVERQEDVTNANGNLFLYNRSEGLRRFSGAEATFQSSKIDNELRKIPADSPRFMLAHANKVKFFCDLKNRGYADHAVVFLNQLMQSSPWYCDDNVPVCWAVGDQTSDTVYAMHANYPAVFTIDTPGKYTDFDSSINMAYDTPYKAPGTYNGYNVIRRVFARIIASSTNIWYIGVDFDHQDNPAVWRKYIKQQVDDTPPAEAIFDKTTDAGTQVVTLPMQQRCRDFQVRIRVSTYDAPAMLQYISSEYGTVRSI